MGDRSVGFARDLRGRTCGRGVCEATRGCASWVSSEKSLNVFASTTGPCRVNSVASGSTTGNIGGGGGGDGDGGVGGAADGSKYGIPVK